MIKFEYTLKIEDTSVVFTILNQSKELYTDQVLNDYNANLQNILEKDAIEIRCACSPELGSNYIYLRGGQKNQDFLPTFRSFYSQKEALEYYNNLATTLKTFISLIDTQNELTKEETGLSPIIRKTRSLNVRFKHKLLPKCTTKSVFAKGVLT